MNNEKLQALFESIEIATDELRKATLAANKIQQLNGDKATIQKMISNFVAVRNNSNAIVEKTNESLLFITDVATKSLRLTREKSEQMLDDTRKRSLVLRWTAMITIVASLSISSCLIGFGVGVYMSHQPIVKDLDVRLQLKNKFGIVVNDKAIAIPSDVIIKRINNRGDRIIPMQ